MPRRGWKSSGKTSELRRDDNVPADIALLHATGPNGMAYIETMALDGETNLKSKQACPLLAGDCSSVAGMAACEAEVVSEDPNLDLYNYEGRVTAKGKTMPLTMNQVLYRGSTLRNTNQAVGLVINTGEECKIRMNAHKNVRAKAPEMQYAVNRIVILLVFFVVSLSIGLTIGYQIWRRRYENRAWYLRRATVPLKEILIGFIIVFNTLIPLSLYVSLEIVKLGQLYFLHDTEMYDPITDTAMVANTSTILENLGQVSYVFSDKTGTLTENIMKFRKMSVAGTAFLHDPDLQEAEEKRNRDKKGMAEKPKTKRRGSSRKHAAGDTDPAPGNGRPSEDVDVSRPPTTLPAYSVHAEPIQPELLKTEDLIRYIRQKPNTPFSRKVRQFILCIALCHTCLPETGDDGEITFQAASPDELALVEAARDLGYLVIDRPAQSIKLQSLDVNGSTVMDTYEVLDVIEFSSKRKRMSIVIRMPDERV
jgi:phospholipid-translocating ATPase